MTTGVSLIDYIQRRIGCGLQEANLVYRQILRMPGVVRLGIIYHIRDEQENLVPMVAQDKAEQLDPFVVHNQPSLERPSRHLDEWFNTTRAADALVWQIASTLARIDVLDVTDATKQALKAAVTQGIVASDKAGPSDDEIECALKMYLGYAPPDMRSLVSAVRREAEDTQAHVHRVCDQFGLRPRPRLQIANGLAVIGQSM
jgi:hypothetical protein